MRSVIGILFGNTRSDLLQGLTQDRPIAAVPFGGKYRLMDFALSSFVNSGIRTVGLITPQHYRPVLDHTGAGKDWHLDRKAGGLFILPGAIHGLAGDQYKFRMKDMALNLEFLEKDNSENVVITYCNQVFNINFREALNFHEEKQANITLIYKELENPLDYQGRKTLTLNDHQEVLSFDEGSRENRQASFYFVDMLIIRRKLLLEMIDGYLTMDDVDLLDVITENLKQLEVYAYQTSAYIGRIRSLFDYFQRNMDLFDTKISQELFRGKNPIYTKVRDNPPTLYNAQANIRNSIVSCGCTLEGEVEHSIISRGVIVKPGAQIKNSILLQKCSIGENAVLENVILDKFVEVKDGNVLKGNPNNPLVITKKSIV